MGGPLITDPGISLPMRTRARRRGAAGAAGGSSGRLRARRPIVGPIVAARATAARGGGHLVPQLRAARGRYGREMSSRLHIVVLVVVCAAAIAAVAGRSAAPSESAVGGPLLTRDGDTIEISPAVRAAGLRFAPGVAAADRAWILAAVARARPGAGRPVGEVDGLVEIRTDLRDPAGALGLTQSGLEGIAVSFDLTRLDGPAALQRDTVVLHELGHVVDFAVVPRALDAQLDAGIPRGGPCTSLGDRIGACARPEERFADTFAKWTLRGDVSAAGAGYAIAAPASLE